MAYAAALPQAQLFKALWDLRLVCCFSVLSPSFSVIDSETDLSRSVFVVSYGWTFLLLCFSSLLLLVKGCGPTVRGGSSAVSLGLPGRDRSLAVLVR